MDEFTAEQVKVEAAYIGQFRTDHAKRTHAMLLAFAAHLAPREVSDEDVERALDVFRGKGDMWRPQECMRAALQADRQRGGRVVAPEIIHGHLAPEFCEIDEDGNGYFFTCEGLEAFAKALLAQRGQVREGWKMVPVEPTEEMLIAASRTSVPIYAWQRMLAAAPDADAEGKGNG